MELARGAHTLLDECSFPDDEPVPGHLTPGGAPRMARESGVEQVVLTHTYPPTDALDLAREVRREYEGEVVLAEDGLRFGV